MPGGVHWGHGEGGRLVKGYKKKPDRQIRNIGGGNSWVVLLGNATFGPAVGKQLKQRRTCS